MKIRAERDDLADVFDRANRGVSPRTTLPILTGVLCEVAGSTLCVTGTDLEITVRTNTEVDVIKEGRTLVPAKLAAAAIRKMPAGAVTLSSSDGELEILGAGPKFTVRELPVDEFPQLPEVDQTKAVEVNGDSLAAAIAQVTIAAATDAARPILTAVLIENDDDGLRLVATDSYRLSMRKLKGISLPTTGLVPARGLRELVRTVGASKVSVSIPDREAVFASDRGLLTLRLIEGVFPNYRQLLPSSYPNQVIVKKEALMDALGRAALVAEDHIPVRLRVTENGIEITATRQDVGGETEQINGAFTGEDNEVTIAFNPKYLMDGIAAMGVEDIEIQMIDGLKPSVIRGVGDEDFLYLLMPVRVA